MIGSLSGGIGLFLLGMWLMTDGMKTAAGPALQRILANATKTRLRALASGVLVTAVVQSSSAVTMTAIGFVNAGLLTLGQALWVLFGANVGTTMTGWLVAAAGSGFQVEALALPLVGIGMLLHTVGRGGRRAAVGMTLAGSGLLFLGIDVLKSGFLGAASQYALPQAGGVVGILLHLVAGVLLTVLMQSSSASLAVALTAAQGGMLPLESAAAVVIGANLGTTTTAILAASGATANAKRAAAAHVLFNLLTGAVALLILPLLLRAVLALQPAISGDGSPGTTLALFHTAFNLFGVVLMWPLAGWLTAFLQARFRSADEDLARPRYLDRNLKAVPELAISALAHELDRMRALSVGLVRAAMAGGDAEGVARRAEGVNGLKGEIARFVTELSRASMSAEISLRLAWLLRVLRYYSTVTQIAHALGTAATPLVGQHAPSVDAVRHWAGRADQLLSRVEDGVPAPVLEAEPGAIEADYQAAKAALLQAGAAGNLELAEMEALLQSCSLLHRAVQQAIKAGQVMANLGAPAEQLVEADDGVPLWEHHGRQ